MTDQIKLNLKELFKTYPSILVVYFYGSGVTGYTNKQSDLDLAVVVDDPTAIDYGDLYLKINQIIKNQEVDLRIVTLTNTPTYLFQVLKNSQRIYQRDELERVNLESQILRDFYDTQHIRDIYDSYLKQAF